jgi:hypothetical protein
MKGVNRGKLKGKLAIVIVSILTQTPGIKVFGSGWEGYGTPKMRISDTTTHLWSNKTDKINWKLFSQPPFACLDL